jgi:hypothetical protein
MTQLRKFIEWLSFHPTPDEIARALVTEYLTDQGVKAIRFGRINSDDSAMILGQFGHADAEQWRNLVVPGSEWRQWTTPEIDIITGKNKDSWSPDSLTCVISLRDRGVMQGNNVVEFTHPVSDSDKARVLDRVEDFCIPISIFHSKTTHRNHLIQARFHSMTLRMSPPTNYLPAKFQSYVAWLKARQTTN